MVAEGDNACQGAVAPRLVHKAAQEVLVPYVDAIKYTYRQESVSWRACADKLLMDRHSDLGAAFKLSLDGTAT